MQNEKSTLMFSNPIMKSKKLLLGLALCQALGLSAVAADWPQWLGAKRDGVWRESGILKKFPEGGPKVNWRVPIGGGYAGPAVADGRVFIMDRQLAKGTANPDNQFDRGMIPQRSALRIDFSLERRAETAELISWRVDVITEL